MLSEDSRPSRDESALLNPRGCCTPASAAPECCETATLEARVGLDDVDAVDDEAAAAAATADSGDNIGSHRRGWG